jgi:hypothetical protein
VHEDDLDRWRDGADGPPELVEDLRRAASAGPSEASRTRIAAGLAHLFEPSGGEGAPAESSPVVVAPSGTTAEPSRASWATKAGVAVVVTVAGLFLGWPSEVPRSTTSGARSDDTPRSEVPASDTPASDTPTSDTPASDTPTSDDALPDAPRSDLPRADTARFDPSSMASSFASGPRGDLSAGVGAPPRPEPTRRPPPSEVELLETARRSLTTSPRRALHELDRAARTYPDGVFSEEREALRIEAHAAAGDRERAEALLARFVRERPTSAHLPRLRAGIASMP